jgi:hypothetical protein
VIGKHRQPSLGVRTMLTLTIRYARYALAALSSVGFGLSTN